MEVNFKLLKKIEKEIIEYEGWIPYPFPLFIDMDKRDDYLKNKGIFKEIHLEHLKEREELKKCDDVYTYRIRKLENWLIDNPEYDGIIII